MGIGSKLINLKGAKMSKKFTIISTLTALSISTLGAIVPTFADTSTTYYAIDEIIAFHQEVQANIEETCREAIASGNSYTINTCSTNVKNGYASTSPGLYAASKMVNLAAKGLLVSAYNPYAGTMRFYIDDNMFGTTPLNLQDLIIFWADKNYVNYSGLNNSSSRKNSAESLANAILAGDEVPEGIHMMYDSTKDSEELFKITNTEHRIVLDDESNLLTDSAPKTVFVLGHDATGVLRYRTDLYGQSCQNLATDSECQIRYVYENSTGQATGWSLYSNKATAEDLAIAEQKELIKKVKAAEDRAAAAEATAREAEAAAREAEATAREAEAAAREAEFAAGEAENNAREAENSAREAESAAREAENNARNAESAALAAESAAKAAEERANQFAAEALSVATESERIATEATRAAEIATRTAEEARRTASEANQTALAAKETAAQFAKIAEDLNRQLTAVSQTIAEIQALVLANNQITPTAPITNNYITYNTTEIVKNESSAATDTPEAATTSLVTPDDSVEVPLAAGPAESKNIPEFPWWIVAFAFSGIFLILWWFIPARKRRES